MGLLTPRKLRKSEKPVPKKRKKKKKLERERSFLMGMHFFHSRSNELLPAHISSLLLATFPSLPLGPSLKLTFSYALSSEFHYRHRVWRWGVASTLQCQFGIAAKLWQYIEALQIAAIRMWYCSNGYIMEIIVAMPIARYCCNDAAIGGIVAMPFGIAATPQCFSKCPVALQWFR